MARRRARREVAQGPQRAPRRHRRAGDRARAASASARRSRPTRSCTCPIPTCSRRWSTSTSPRSASPRPRRWSTDEGPADAFRLPDVRASPSSPSSPKARKCARSWKVSPAVGTDPDYPDVTPRDAQALREWDTMRKAADGGVSRRCLWGPLARLGLDRGGDHRAARPGAQALAAVRLRPRRQAASSRLTPFLDLVLIWNKGISYGLFQQDGPLGQWALLALKVGRGRAAVDLAGAGRHRG